MSKVEQTNKANEGRSRSTEVLNATTCAIGGVFASQRGLAACRYHIGGINGCAFTNDCEHKRVADLLGAAQEVR